MSSIPPTTQSAEKKQALPEGFVAYEDLPEDHRRQLFGDVSRTLIDAVYRKQSYRLSLKPADRGTLVIQKVEAFSAGNAAGGCTNAEAVLPPGYIATGGGAASPTLAKLRLLTASYPFKHVSGVDGWRAESKDHDHSDPGATHAWVIGIVQLYSI